MAGMESECLGTVFLKFCGAPTICRPIEIRNNSTLHELLDSQGVSESNIKYFCNGKLINDESVLITDSVVYAVPGLLGGKGGFGSMLRAIGAQIEKTTNREACRDLSGRRLRDINEEKRLKKWLSKQGEREQEIAARRSAKYDQLNSVPKHHFVDKDYDKTRSAVTDNIHNAVSYGLEKSSTGVKRKKPDLNEPCSSTSKKPFMLSLGDDDELSSSDEDCIPTTSPVSCTRTIPKPSTSSCTGRDMSGSDEVSSSSSNDVVEKEEPKVKNIDANVSSSNDQKSSASLNSDLPEGPLELETVETVSQLEELGLDQLKAELINRGMKCGGTLQERASRLFSVRGVQVDQIDPTLLAKPKRR